MAAKANTKAKMTTKSRAVPPAKAGTKRKAEDALPPKRSVKKATTSKTAPAKKEAPQKMAKKRKAEEDAPASKRSNKKVLIKGPVLSEPPIERINVYVFGEGSSGELGLGTAKNAMDVKRPRMNAMVSPDKVGLVKIEAGGMHVIGLSHDNKIYTWGVNDQGALGRNTAWEGGLRDMDAADDSSDDEEDDNGLNPKESTPGQVDWSQTQVAEGTRFVDIAAGDSASFAVTDDGRVYGWGTFRDSSGVLGFTPDVKIADRPVLLKDLKNVVSIKAGSNHALALTKDGKVYSWGCGQQNQLGRRVIERAMAKGETLYPREFGLPRKAIASIGTGSDHSFAIAKNGDVYAWGLNNMGETGIREDAGTDGGAIKNPTIVESLQGKEIVSIAGGSHHSIAATKDGDCLVWGRMDGAQMGIPREDMMKLPDGYLINDEHDKPRILVIPQKVTAIKGAVTEVAASSDHNVVITKEGKAWSWGFSTNYQTGLGTEDDVPVATMIDNTAIRDKKLNFATAGGQFSIITCPADVGMVNGA